MFQREPVLKPLNSHFKWVAVTGVEAVCSLGTQFDEITKNLKAGKCGLSKEHRFRRTSDKPLGEIDHSAFDSYSKKLADLDGAVYRIVYAMIEKLIGETNLLKRYSANRIGIFFGTSTSCLDRTQGSFFNYIEKGDKQNLDLVRSHHLNGATVKMIKKFFPIRGIDQTFSTACSSSAHSIAEGFEALNLGLIDAAIVGGFDILNEVTICGFDALQILDSQICRPFANDREGTNLSEGGGFLVLERETSQKSLATLVGIGASSDAFQMTQPDPEAEGMKLSMLRALHCAGLNPADISYINAHGTGTEPNDRCEILAINKIFGSEANAPAISSTKGYHGHALGGAGALEAAVSIAAILENRAWPQLNQSFLVGPSSKSKINYVLSNSFGFGGNNVSLIFGLPHLEAK